MVRADELSGKKVIGPNGNVVGEVSGIDLDVIGLRAKYIYVDLSERAAKELGIKTSFWTMTNICLPISSISQVGDVITLNKNSNEL